MPEAHPIITYSVVCQHVEHGELLETCLLDQEPRGFLSVLNVLGDYMGRKNKRSNTDLSRLAQKLHVPRAEVVKSQKEKSKLGVEPKGGEPLNSQAANIPM